MKLTVHGCSGGISKGRKTTALRLNDTVLLDAGTGICDLPLAELEKIRHIFLTHSHLDHIAGIPLLIDTVFESIVEPITVHGRKETMHALQNHIFNDVIWPNFARIPNAKKPVLRFQEMALGEKFEIAGCVLESIPVEHAVAAVGYRIESNGWVMAFSGDTGVNESFWQVLNSYPKLDALIVETAFPERDHALSLLAKHYCPSSLATDMAKLKHRPKVYITHLKPGAEDEIMDECKAALPDFEVHPLQDGQVFNFQ